MTQLKPLAVFLPGLVENIFGSRGTAGWFLALGNCVSCDLSVYYILWRGVTWRMQAFGDKWMVFELFNAQIWPWYSVQSQIHKPRPYLSNHDSKTILCLQRTLVDEEDCGGGESCQCLVCAYLCCICTCTLRSDHQYNAYQCQQQMRINKHRHVCASGTMRPANTCLWTQYPQSGYITPSMTDNVCKNNFVLWKHRN